MVKSKNNSNKKHRFIPYEERIDIKNRSLEIFENKLPELKKKLNESIQKYNNNSRDEKTAKIFFEKMEEYNFELWIYNDQLLEFYILKKPKIQYGQDIKNDVFRGFRELLNGISKSCVGRVGRYLIHMDNKRFALNNIKGSEKDKVKDIAKEAILLYIESTIKLLPIILFDIRLDIQNILNFAEKNWEILSDETE